jgi:hypothetical protein
LIFLTEVEFHRSFSFRYLGSKHFELMQLTVSILGPVDPQSGMVLNLAILDQWIFSFRSATQEKTWGRRSDFFSAAHAFFAKLCKKEGVQFNSLSLKTNEREVCWSKQLNWPKVLLGVSISFDLASSTPGQRLKRMSARLYFRGPLGKSFKKPKMSFLRKVYSEYHQNSSPQFLEKKARASQLSKIEFFDPELNSRVQVLFF